MPLRPVSYEQVDAWSPALEDLVDQTPGVDPWCSGPDWVLASNRAFAPDAKMLVSGSPGSGLVLLARYLNPETGESVLSELEPMWGFASPVLGPDPAGLIAETVDGLRADPDWHTLLLPGLPLDESILIAMASELSSLGPVRFGVAIEREVADMSAGWEAWLDRRSPRFRRNLRQLDQRATDAGLSFEDVSNQPDLFARILGVEHLSWKGQEGSGISSPEMSRMYSTIIDRLGAASRLHCLVAVVDGADIGYILGGTRGTTYRGLQISYDQSRARLGIGHLLQWAQIRSLPASVHHYDMGMSITYKQRWSDKSVPSPALVVTRAQ